MNLSHQDNPNVLTETVNTSKSNGSPQKMMEVIQSKPMMWRGKTPKPTDGVKSTKQNPV
jgi:hypothetical protein